MSAHLIDGEFQSDKYPTTPRGKVPLSCKDPTAQDLLWEYAQRRRAVDAEFSDDLECALKIAGYVPVGLWRPIETAPRNGDDILVYYEFAETPIAHIAFWDDGEFWKDQKFDSQEEARGWWSYVRGSVTQEKLDGGRMPTHWMPFEGPEAK
jgi:hypothetical protein